MTEKMFSISQNTQFNVEDILVDDNKAALPVTILGREVFKDRPLLPTILEIFKIENDKVTEIWGVGISPEKFLRKFKFH
ncbi:hypothetical protein ACFOG5_19090 [Pedobacter fastidiosus]|uniref:Uncharacterized protein n=1 Tax=Pedobacter fastidiosus TaxID=2765361 RepID=A0ABR7KY17_9SPHI|nr:hypothetical protein [Pedobacter fastidiosus]MBC6113021.1 hypothetical protein [Pedobacter fastidiosus]